MVDRVFALARADRFADLAADEFLKGQGLNAYRLWSQISQDL